MISHSETETQQLAKQLIESRIEELKNSSIILLLAGDLGTGKTQFAKGVAKALGIYTEIISPSYLYIRNYPFKQIEITGNFVHVDAWRVNDIETWSLLRVEDYIKPGNVILIEWPKREFVNSLREYSKAKIIDIKLKDLGLEEREIEIIQ